MKNWKKALLAALCISMAATPGMSLTTVMADETELGEVPVVEGLTTVDGKIYYYKDGKAVKGWVTVDGAKYYFGKDGAAYAAGSDRNILVKKIGSYYYGFNKKGKMIAGKFCNVKVKKSGKTKVYRYYFTSSGKAYAGKKTSYGVKLAIKKIGGKQYGFLANGCLVKGVYYNGKKLYYFDKNTGVYSAAKTKKLNAAAVYEQSDEELMALLGTPNKKVQVDSCYAETSVGSEYLLYYDSFVVDVFKYNTGTEIFLAVMSK